MTRAEDFFARHRRDWAKAEGPKGRLEWNDDPMPAAKRAPPPRISFAPSTMALFNDRDREVAANAVYEAPEGWIASVREPTRSLAQNALLHARLTEISRRRTWAEMRHDVETWKRLFVASWLRARGETIDMLPALDGKGIDVIYRRTSLLTAAECAELIDYIDAWDAVTNEER